MKNIIISILFVAYSFQVLADNLSNSNVIFDWAEENFPRFFSLPSASTQFSDPWLYRYYPATDVYAGGGEFTIQLYVGRGQQWLGQVSTNETNDMGFPVFLGGVPDYYCFQMIATTEVSDSPILGSGSSGNKAPCT